MSEQGAGILSLIPDGRRVIRQSSKCGDWGIPRGRRQASLAGPLHPLMLSSGGAAAQRLADGGRLPVTRASRRSARCGAD
ncbi:hypothetical protein [Paenibacillus chitinolyticus]|uniref:hypothetical protein n=1 Tax=Paenibacillus chitinolyticus TaxID=79263 RepID=UPI00366E57BA